MTRPRKRSWLAALLSLLLLVTMVAPALAQAPALTSEDAIQFLVDHKIVQGDQYGNLNLQNTITRAELAKIVVVAKGQDSLVPVLAPLVQFADSRGHWGAGYIEAAARLNLIKGRDANTFDPDAQITYAEALTILLRMVGQEPLVWSPLAVMQRAAELGIIPNTSLEILANMPISRGVVFEALTLTMRVPLADGSTLAQQLDLTPPALTVSAPSSTAADRVTVVGTATGAYAVTVNGQAVALTNGRFSTEVSLRTGANTITVVAYDVAGNETTEKVTVVRGGDVAAISVTGPTSVKAGESVTLNVRPTDAQGNVLPGSVLTATVADNMGSFDTATGRFTAGSKAGTATITFTASTGVTETYEITVLGLAAEAEGLRVRTPDVATVGSSARITVEVIDGAGQVVAYDDGRLISLSVSGLSGVNIPAQSVRTSQGVATFNVTGSVAGTAKLTATSTGLGSATSDLTFASSTRIKLEASSTSGVADGVTPITIKAVLTDASGKAVANSTGDDIIVKLSVDSDRAYVSGYDLVIRRGTTSSAGTAQVIPGITSETVRVTGTVIAGEEYTVVPVAISFKEPVIGAASKFEIVGQSQVDIAGKDEGTARVIVRVTDKDGNLITNGSFAFQVKVWTSNDDDLEDGIPRGVDVTLGSTGETPISGAEDAIVARTEKGTAELYVTYDRSGIVYLEVVGVSAAKDALNAEGEEGSASSATQFSSETQKVYFIGAMAGLDVRVDIPSADLTNQEVGVLGTKGTTQATINVYVVDGEGGRIPNATGAITLKRSGDGVTQLVGTSKVDEASTQLSGGVASFKIRSTSKAGVDFWTPTYSLVDDPDAEVTIYVNDESPDTPEIKAIYGESGQLNVVLTGDAYMEIHLEPSASINTYGYVKVYRSSSSTKAVYTSDVIDLSAAPVVRVPRSALSGSTTYTVAVNNGYSDSKKSAAYPDGGEKVVLQQPIKVNITKVRYDANQHALIITITGGTTTAEIDSSLLYLDNPSVKDEEVDLTGAYCAMQKGSRTTIQCDLPGSVSMDPSKFRGGVVLKTRDGWYVNSNGGAAEADDGLSGNVVAPFAYISHASVDFTRNRLYLHGANLDQSKIYLNKLQIGSDSLGASDKDTVQGGSKKVTITSPKGLDLTSITGASKLDALEGWIKVDGYLNPGSMDIPILAELQVSKVTYSAGKITITGSGFAEGTVYPKYLKVTDGNGKILTIPDDGNEVLFWSTGTVDESGRVVITLGPLEKAAIESAMAKGRVYLVADEFDPEDGQTWFETKDGLYGMPLQGRYQLN